MADEFFEPPPVRAPDEDEREPYVQPAWMGPPGDVLPGVVALELVLARSDRAAVCMSRLSAYPTGFSFDLLTATARHAEDLDPLLFAGAPRPPTRASGQAPAIPQQLLRIGVQFSDGSKATNTGASPFDVHDPQAEPSGPRLIPGGGGGGGSSWQVSMWVWPLPPPGPLTFVCQWPAANLPLTASRARCRHRDGGRGALPAPL